jgi:hypothetical protein
MDVLLASILVLARTEANCELPPAEHLLNFPSREVSYANWKIAKKWHGNARCMARETNDKFWINMEQQSKLCLQAWEYLADAHMYSDKRRDNLHNLWMLLGDCNYSAGRMPEPIPLWLLMWRD